MEFYTKRLKAQRIPQPVPMILLFLKYSGGELYVEGLYRQKDSLINKYLQGTVNIATVPHKTDMDPVPGMLRLVAILLVGLLACRIFASCTVTFWAGLGLRCRGMRERDGNSQAHVPQSPQRVPSKPISPQ